MLYPPALLLLGLGGAIGGARLTTPGYGDSAREGGGYRARREAEGGERHPASRKPAQDSRTFTAPITMQAAR
jgi:hypothetical protein